MSFIPPISHLFAIILCQIEVVAMAQSRISNIDRAVIEKFDVYMNRKAFLSSFRRDALRKLFPSSTLSNDSEDLEKYFLSEIDNLSQIPEISDDEKKR